jgi:hypothetical protein
MVRSGAVATVAAVIAQRFSVLPAGRAGVGADERRHLPAAAVADFGSEILSRHINATSSAE